MEWISVRFSDFLKERKTRFKPNDNQIYDLKRIDKIDFSGKIYLSSKPSKTNMILVKNGDLVISGINVEKGAMNIYQGEEDVVATIHYSSYIYDDKVIDLEFLKHFLKSKKFTDILKEQVPGGIKTEIKPKHLLPLKLLIPKCLDDQKKIVEKLDSLNSEISILSVEVESQLFIISQLRQAFLREAMQGKLVSNETSDSFTGQNLLKLICDHKAKLLINKKLKKGKITKNAKCIIDLTIPDNWIFAKFDDLFFVTKLAGFEYTDHMNLLDKSDVPVVRAQNVKNLKLNKSNLLYIDLKTSLVLDRCSLNKECLLITFIGAGIGEVATFTEKVRWHLAPNVAKAEPFLEIEDLYSVKYFNYYLISSYGFSEIKKHMKATAQPSLSMETIRDIDIPLPPLEIQKRIVSKLDELMEYCNHLENSVKESQKYNEQLLQQVLREALEGKEVSKKEILSLVAEKSATYQTVNNLTKNCDLGDMAILSGYIIKKLSTKNTKDFGRVKLQKMLHLTEYHCQLSSELNYQKNVAGPYSEDLEKKVEPKLKSFRFFDIKKEKLGNNSKVTYTPLSASSQLATLFNKEFQDQAGSINLLLEKFQNKTWEFCEMISTMYAVWNNRLIRKEEFTNEILKQDFLAWDEKKKRFIDQLDYAIEWIKKEKIEPVGFGEYIDKK